MSWIIIIINGTVDKEKRNEKKEKKRKNFSKCNFFDLFLVIRFVCLCLFQLFFIFLHFSLLFNHFFIFFLFIWMFICVSSESDMSFVRHACTHSKQFKFVRNKCVVLEHNSSVFLPFISFYFHIHWSGNGCCCCCSFLFI